MEESVKVETILHRVTDASGLGVIASDGSVWDIIKDVMALKTSGYINCDFEDIEYALKDSRCAFITSVMGEGPHRIAESVKKFEEAAQKKGYPIASADKMLIKILCDKEGEHPVKVDEISELVGFTSNIPATVDFKWSIGNEHTLGEKVKLIFFMSYCEKEKKK